MRAYDSDPMIARRAILKCIAPRQRALRVFTKNYNLHPIVARAERSCNRVRFRPARPNGYNPWSLIRSWLHGRTLMTRITRKRSVGLSVCRSIAGCVGWRSSVQAVQLRAQDDVDGGGGGGPAAAAAGRLAATSFKRNRERAERDWRWYSGRREICNADRERRALRRISLRRYAGYPRRLGAGAWAMPGIAPPCTPSASW